MLFMGKSERARERERARASCVSGERCGVHSFSTVTSCPAPKKASSQGDGSRALASARLGVPYARMVFVGAFVRAFVGAFVGIFVEDLGQMQP